MSRCAAELGARAARRLTARAAARACTLSTTLSGTLACALACALSCALLAGCGGTPSAPPSAAQAQATAGAERASRAMQRGDWAQARVQSEAALAAAQALQDPALSGAALLNLALVHARAGELPAAHARLDRILNASPGSFDTGLRARAAARKALLLAGGGDGPRGDGQGGDGQGRDGQAGQDSSAAALRWADQAEALCASPCTLAPTLDNLRAYVALRRGDASQAEALAARAATAAAAPAQATERATAWRLRGQALSRLGQADAAAQALADALALDRQLGLPERIALDLLAAADHARSRGQTAQAEAFDERAATVYAALGDTKRAEALRARQGTR